LGERIQIGIRIVSNLANKLWRRRGQRSLWAKAYWPDHDFVPPSFTGQVTLFKRPKQPYYYVRDPEMGWGSRAVGGVDVQVLPIHHSEMLHEPHVRILAQRLRECLHQRFQEVPAAPTTRPDDEGELAISSGEASGGAS
jgi:thioesterase domain-containing protein